MRAEAKFDWMEEWKGGEEVHSGSVDQHFANFLARGLSLYSQTLLRTFKNFGLCWLYLSISNVL